MENWERDRKPGEYWTQVKRLLEIIPEATLLAIQRERWWCGGKSLPYPYTPNLNSASTVVLNTQHCNNISSMGWFTLLVTNSWRVNEYGGVNLVYYPPDENVTPFFNRWLRGKGLLRCVYYGEEGIYLVVTDEILHYPTNSTHSRDCEAPSFVKLSLLLS